MSTITHESILYAVDAGVATITLNRPDSLNAMSPGMAAEVTAALRDAEADSAVRAIVLTGAGRAFSSGADLRAERMLTPEGKPDLLGALRTAFNPMILAVREVPKPVVAVANGPVVGISMSLACACDLILAAESAYFLLAFVNIALTVDGAAARLLPARIGMSRAAELALLGGRLPAAQALEWGLVNRVVADAELGAATAELAARLAGGPPGAYASIKALFNESCLPDLAERLDREAVLQQERGESADFAEGVTALFQKRPASFTGA